MISSGREQNWLSTGAPTTATSLHIGTSIGKSRYTFVFYWSHPNDEIYKEGLHLNLLFGFLSPYLQSYSFKPRNI